MVCKGIPHVAWPSSRTDTGSFNKQLKVRDGTENTFSEWSLGAVNFSPGGGCGKIPRLHARTRPIKLISTSRGENTPVLQLTTRKHSADKGRAHSNVFIHQQIYIEELMREEQCWFTSAQQGASLSPRPATRALDIVRYIMYQRIISMFSFTSCWHVIILSSVNVQVLGCHMRRNHPVTQEMVTV